MRVQGGADGRRPRPAPAVEDQGWFFDTELLVLAEHNGLRIHEVPVDWVDDPDSRVDVVETAKADLRGVWRMWRSRRDGLPRTGRPPPDPRWRRRPPSLLAGPRQPARAVRLDRRREHLLFALLFALLAGPLGPGVADIVALGVCAVANTAANRRLTFALRGDPAGPPLPRWPRARAPPPRAHLLTLLVSRSPA